MNVHWLEQTEANVPPENDWLDAGELTCLNSMRFPKRRADWRLGRWTAKRAISIYMNLPSSRFVDIVVLPAPSGAPEVFLADEPAEISISISHCDGTAACAVAPSIVPLGCDMETVEPRSAAFLADYFTREEQELVAKTCAPDRSLLINLLWSAKESALKALHEGLRLDTRSVVVRPTFSPCIPGRWLPLHVFATSEDFHGWWQHSGDLVRTLVATPPPPPPILLG